MLCIVGELHNNRKKQSLTLEFSPVELGSTNVFFAKENNRAKLNTIYPRFIDATSPVFAEKANHTLDSLSKMLFHSFGNLKEPLEYGSSFQIEYGDQNYLSITILSAEPLNAFDKDVGMVYPYRLVFDKKGQKLLKLGDIFDTSQKFFSTVFNKISSEQLTSDPSFDTGQLASNLELTTESFDNFSICCEGLKITLEPSIIARYPVDVIIPWPAIKEFMTKDYKF